MRAILVLSSLFQITIGMAIPGVGSGPTPSHQTGCYFYDRWYSIGETVENRLSEDRCMLLVCQSDGSMQLVPGPYCKQKASPVPPAPTTIIPRTEIPTPRGGCYYNGKWFANGEEIEKGQSGHWCYEALCQDGNVLYWDNFRCSVEPTFIPTTVAVTVSPPVIHVG